MIVVTIFDFTEMYWKTSNDLNFIEKFNNTYRYLHDLCSLNNTLFQTNITAIYPKELILLQSNSNDNKATFLDLAIQIHNLLCTIKIYDKRDDFDFDIVNFPSLDGDIPISPSYGTSLSQFIRFARVCNKVEDFNDRNSILSRKLLKQVFLYHKLRKTFPKF